MLAITTAFSAPMSTPASIVVVTLRTSILSAAGDLVLVQEDVLEGGLTPLGLRPVRLPGQLLAVEPHLGLSGEQRVVV